MRDLVDYVAKQLVSKPDEVSVEENVMDEGVNLVLKVDPSDMGIIIGKSGQTIKALRKLLLVRAIADGKRVNLELFEPSGGIPQEPQLQETF